jgi:excisionase family DNA binding protein
MSTHQSPAFGDVAAVAAYLGVSDRTVRRMLADGLRHVKFGQGQQAGVRIAWADLAAWLDAHAVER